MDDTVYSGATHNPMAALRSYAARRGFRIRSLHKSNNPDEAKWVLVRIGTGEIVSKRPMTMDEIADALEQVEIQ